MKFRIQISIAAIFLSCCLAACFDSKTAKVERVLATPLVLPEELSDTTSLFSIVRYVKPKSCTSCELDLGMWRIYRKNLQRRFKDKVGVKFIVETPKAKEVSKLLSMYKFMDISSIDSTGIFTQNNKAVSDLGFDVVMLVDNKNKVILIGDPSRNTQIQALTDSIVGQQIATLSPMN